MPIIDDAELGKIIKDYRDNEAQIAQLQAQAAQASENFTLLADTLKSSPQDITVTDAALIMEGTQPQGRAIALQDLDIHGISAVIQRLQQAEALRRELNRQLHDADFGRLAHALESQQPHAPDIPARESK